MFLCTSISRQLRTLGGVFYTQSCRTYALLPKEPFKQKPFSLERQSVILPGPERIRASVFSDDPNQLIKDIPGSPEVQTVYNVLDHGMKVSNDGPCIGTRPPGSKEFIWQPYSTVISRTKSIGSGFMELGLKPSNDSFVGIFAANKEEFLLTLYSCAGYSMVIVPLYLSLGVPSVVYIINLVKLPIVISNNNENTSLILNNAKNLPTLKTLVVCEEPSEEHITLAKSVNIKLITFADIEKTGQANKKELVLPHPEDMLCVPFTSGTTGTPKGVIVTHRNMIACCASLVYGYGEAGLYGGTIISYLPPGHIYEICNEIASLYFARGIVFYTDDIKNLFEEVRKLKLTILPLVPRLMGAFFANAVKKIKQSKIKTALVPIALWHKEKLVKSGKTTKKTIWDKYLFKDFQESLGGETHMVTSTSAPIPLDIMRFFTLASGAHIHEVYGSTESLAAVMTLPHDINLAGHVGGPMVSNHVKLIDVAEMGYFAKDDCGEICIKGHNVFKGYLNNPEATNECLKDGWYHTGDVGKWLPNGALKVIDRKKNLFKLSQGEYIAPEKVENVYKFCPLVLQVFVDGIAEKDFVIGLIVPEPTLFKKWLAEKGYTKTENLAELLSSKDVRRDFLKELHIIGKKKHLNSLEQVRNMAFLSEPFTTENGMMTPTFKIKRNLAKKRYETLYHKMYQEGQLVTSISS